MHQHNVTTAAQLKAGVDELADHYFGRATIPLDVLMD
jgi:hypothetical protein